MGWNLKDDLVKPHKKGTIKQSPESKVREASRATYLEEDGPTLREQQVQKP